LNKNVTKFGLIRSRCSVHCEDRLSDF
jgi:hypothetical protein